MKQIKIAIIGPESSGKSTLVKELSSMLDAKYVEEYARKYIEGLNRPYNYSDLLTIAKVQKQQENEAFDNFPQILICDSTLMTIKVWSYDKFGKCDLWIEEQITIENYDLTLLCKPDLPWQPDPQREDENRREYLFDVYSSYLNEGNHTYKVIEGHGADRLTLAARYVTELMNGQ